MKATILLIDDDPLDLKVLEKLLEGHGYSTIAVRSGMAGLEVLGKGAVDMVLSDVRMPVMTGVDVVREVVKSYPLIPVVLITAHADVKTAVEAMKLGAFDYVTKPADEAEIVMTVARVLEHSALKRENEFFRSELAVGGMYGERLVGRSPAMQRMYDLIGRVAASDSTVMVTGETGTGKELVAQMIHFKSSRAARPFIAMNCASISQGLTESELFGHEKGAFTGAIAARKGRFEDADGGTLFLDEISESSLEFQAKLLRVLEEGVLQRVGGNVDVKVDVRIIASSNRDLDKEVREGRFREDLFFRLNVVPVEVPSLAERREDIPLLAEHFLNIFRVRYSSPAKGFSKKAMEYLVKQEWRGNVRELQHAVERAVVLAVGDKLEAEDFAVKRRNSGEEESNVLADAIEKCTQDHVLKVLEKVEWRKQRAASELGVDRATLYRLIKRFGLES